MRSRSAKHLSSLSYRALSTTPQQTASKSTTEYSPSQLFISGDPTATKEFLKLQHDDHAQETAASLSRLTRTLRNCSFLLPTLTESLTHIKPPRSAQIKRSMNNHEISKPIRPDSVPPYIVQPWRSSVIPTKDRTVRYADLAEKVRLHVQDLEQQPFPSEVGPTKAEEVWDSVKAMDDDAKDRELREGELKLLAVKARVKAQILRLSEGAEELKKRRMAELDPNERTRKDSSQQQSETARSADKKGPILPSKKRTSLREERRKRAKRAKRAAAPELTPAKARSVHIPPQINEDGSIRFTPLTAASEQKTAILATPTEGWVASAPKQVKTESIGSPNPFAKTKEGTKEANPSKSSTSKGFFGSGRRAEQTVEKAEKASAPAAAEPSKESTGGRSGLLALQAALEKSVRGS